MGWLSGAAPATQSLEMANFRFEISDGRYRTFEVKFRTFLAEYLAAAVSPFIHEALGHFKTPPSFPSWFRVCPVKVALWNLEFEMCQGVQRLARTCI